MLNTALGFVEQVHPQIFFEIFQSLHFFANSSDPQGRISKETSELRPPIHQLKSPSGNRIAFNPLYDVKPEIKCTLEFGDLTSNMLFT